jgi:UDP-glucose 4-epimerase
VITLGTMHILEAIRLLGVERLVWASSAQVFGPLDRYRQRHGVERIVDDSTPEPTTIYGACKAHAELLAAHYARTWELDVTGLRPCGILGPGRRAGATFEVFELIRRVAHGEHAVARRADWVFPLMHISDVVAAFLEALRRPTRGSGHTYNLGGIPTSLREVAGLLQMMVPNASIEIEDCPTMPVATLDASGIQRDLAFSLRRSLADAVAELLEHS